MTNAEKLTALKTAILPDADTDAVLEDTLKLSEALVLNKMYPFGYEDGMTVPARYERLQIELAVELYSKRGAEGQSGHNENGISRTWPEKSAILSRVISHVGSVM